MNVLLGLLIALPALVVLVGMFITQREWKRVLPDAGLDDDGLDDFATCGPTNSTMLFGGPEMMFQMFKLDNGWVLDIAQTSKQHYVTDRYRTFIPADNIEDISNGIAALLVKMAMNKATK